MKKCNGCEQKKDNSAFNKNQKICKECKKIRYKRDYLENKKVYLEKSNERRVKFRKIVSDIKKKLKCVKCGENHNVVLDFHHKDPNEKDFTISYFMNSKYPNEENIKILKEEISKCVVLCANCHRKLHWEQNK